jgi:ATP-dependent helicase/nuclease subunit A
MATIVQAGAGTGKTQSLAEKIISSAKIIHKENGETPRFVATTFTERATSELRERVVSLLAQEKDVPPWLSDFVQDTENLHISTIHGTLSLFLYRYGSLLGLDPEFTILKTSEEKELIGLTLRKVISSDEGYGALLDHYSFGDMIDLTRRLMPHHSLHGANLSVATGWESVFKAEIKILIGALKEISEADLSSLTPKAKITFETLQKLYGHLNSSSEDLVFCRDLLLDALDDIRKPSGAKAKQYEVSLSIIFDEIKKNWKKDKYSSELNQRHDEVAPLFQKLVVQVASEIEKDKRERGLMSFNDLEFLSQQLVKKHPEVLQSWRNQWDFWFIDEFQDTSPLQKDILFSFFRDPWNVYFVGDPQQSIYLFRGADENVFQDTLKMVAQKGGSVERLAKNFRSDPDLMSFLNLIFSKMKNPLSLLEARDKPKGDIKAIVHTVHKSVLEEDIVLSQVNAWLKEGVSFQDMAVLVKTNSKARLIGQKLGQFGVPVYVHSSGGFYDRREILDALGLLSFLEDPSDDESFTLIARSPWIGIKDADLAVWGKVRGKLTFWEWLSQNESVKEMYPNLKVLNQALRDAEILPLSQVFSKVIDDLGFWEFCLVGDSSGRREANLRKFLWSFRKAEEQPQYSAAKFIEDAWQEILDVSEETEAATFIEPERVNIMTVHKSKGLKFKYLIVPFCGDQFRAQGAPLELAPDGRWTMRVLKTDSEEKVGPLMHEKLKEERASRELAESARVFYVAITRASEEIALIGKEDTAKDSWFGQVDIPRSEGEHMGLYNVKNWAEAPQFEKFEPILFPLKEKINLKLVEPVGQNKVRNLTVTQVVQNQKASRFGTLQEQMDSQQRGQAFHFIFEQIKKAGLESLSVVCESATKRFLLSETIEPSIILKTFETCAIPLLEIIKKGRAEWPFVFRDGQIEMKGQIDLWGKVDDATWIIDYKSYKKFTDDNLTSALAQLEIYALAIHKIGVPWENIRVAVVAPSIAATKTLKLSSLDSVRARLVAVAAPAVNS